MKKLLENKAFRLVVLLICVLVIIYESIGLYRDKKEYEIADTEYEKLLDEAVVLPADEETEPAPGSDEKPRDYPNLFIDFSLLESINSDFVGWLYFPYFGISYPVVQETEVDEYLKKTFDGTHNSSGCLFTDILSTPDFTGLHDIIFGHNMRNGSMFGKLKTLNQSEDRDMIKEDPYLYIYTRDNVYKYEVFAYYITTVGSESYSVVSTDSEYDEFLNYISTNSIYPMPDSLDLSSHPSILTLSTCSGRESKRRFVIHTAKIDSWDN